MAGFTPYVIEDLGNGALSIVCFTCYLRSHNRNDVEQRYCGRCHVFHTRYPDDMPSGVSGGCARSRL